MSGLAVAGPLPRKLTQVSCGYQGQVAKKRRKTSAAASQTRSRTRSYFSLPFKHFPAFLLSGFSVARFGEIHPEQFRNLLKRHLGVIRCVIAEILQMSRYAYFSEAIQLPTFGVPEEFPAQRGHPSPRGFPYVPCILASAFDRRPRPVEGLCLPWLRLPPAKPNLCTGP